MRAAPRTHHDRTHRIARLLLLCGVAGAGPLLPGATAMAQEVAEVAVDRWLVAGATVEEGANPLAQAGSVLFPDRDLTVGPGYWSLLREDGRARFDFTAQVESGEAALVHTYLEAPADADVRLTLGTSDCADLRAWLNGQPLPAPRQARDVRLAGGWNTLFAVIGGGPDCPRTILASLAPALGPANDDEAGLTGLRVQASRPPGVRSNFPEGVVTLSPPRVNGLSWGPRRDELVASVAYDLTSWGRGGAGTGPAEGPGAPPAVDLSGEWNLTLFGPTGIQRLIARLEMEADGTLTGELRRNRDAELEAERERARTGGVVEGRIREGWVSGRRFGWTLRTSGRGRALDLEFSGSMEGDELRGTIDFGRLRDDVVGGGIESRFEARRVEQGGTEREPGPGAEAGPAGRPDEAPGSERRTAADDPDELSGPRDPDGQRARMVQQLLGSSRATRPAPPDGSAQLRLAGEELTAASNKLVPAAPVEFEGSVTWNKLRDAALREAGLRAEIRWSGGDRKVEGRVPADGLLRALHRPIDVTGLMGGSDGIAGAQLRVPEALAGFTLRGIAGEWWVGGEPAPDRLLCSPCDRGERIEVGFRGSEGDVPAILVVDRGYPDAAGDSRVPAVEWLRALQGDKRRYRELAGG